MKNTTALNAFSETRIQAALLWIQYRNALDCFGSWDKITVEFFRRWLRRERQWRKFYKRLRAELDGVGNEEAQ